MQRETEMAKEAEVKVVKVVAVPYLAYGHITPMAEMCVALSQRHDFEVTLVSTPLNVRRVTASLSERSHAVSFASVEFPAVEGLAPACESTMDVPHPSQFPFLFDAMQLLRPSLQGLLRRLAPTCVLCDMLMVQVGLDLGLPTLVFDIFGAAATAYYSRSYWPEPPVAPFPPRVYDDVYVRSLQEPARLKVHLEEIMQALRSCRAIVINTCAALEAPYLDFLEQRDGIPVVAVGPLQTPRPPPRPDADAAATVAALDFISSAGRPAVYVAFGSECFLEEEQTREIGMGLLQSGTPFVWVFPRGKKRYLPQPDFHPDHLRHSRAGIVIEGWVDQRRILSAVQKEGAFVSHCGWNSVVEAVVQGVAMVGVPILNDQDINARFVEHELGVGVKVPWHGGRGGHYQHHDVCATLTKVMAEERGRAVRAKARQVSDMLHSNVFCPGGSRDTNVERVAQLMRNLLCIIIIINVMTATSSTYPGRRPNEANNSTSCTLDNNV